MGQGEEKFVVVCACVCWGEEGRMGKRGIRGSGWVERGVSVVWCGVVTENKFN